MLGSLLASPTVEAETKEVGGGQFWKKRGRGVDLAGKRASGWGEGEGVKINLCRRVFWFRPSLCWPVSIFNCALPAPYSIFLNAPLSIHHQHGVTVIWGKYQRSFIL